MRKNERGSLTIMVLILMALGSTVIYSSLTLLHTGVKSKEVQTARTEQQYARDAGSEFAMWQLIYGDAALQLAQGRAKSTTA